LLQDLGLDKNRGLSPVLRTKTVVCPLFSLFATAPAY
jgi:hypothetical protein